MRPLVRDSPTRPQDRAIMQLALAGCVIRDTTIFSNGRIHVRSQGLAVVVIERDGRMRSLLPYAHPLRAANIASRRAA